MTGMHPGLPGGEEPPVVRVARRDGAVFTCPFCGSTGRYRTYGQDLAVGALDMDGPGTGNEQALSAATDEVVFACLADRTQMRRWRLALHDAAAGDA